MLIKIFDFKNILKRLSPNLEKNHYNREAKLHFTYTSKNMTDNATGKKLIE